MGFTYADSMIFNMAINPKGYITGGNSIVNMTSQIARSFSLAQIKQQAFNDTIEKGGKKLNDLKIQQQMASLSMVQYASAATTAGVAAFYFFKKINESVKIASDFQKTLLDINIASGNFSDNFDDRTTHNIVSNIKKVQSGLYGLHDTAKSYFLLSSAGFQGTTRFGKDITQMGVKYAQYYHILSRGKISLEEAANFIPELAAKTGATLQVQLNNGETILERYLDMMGKAEVITKIKMENMRDILDASGASFRNLGVSFGAGLAIVGAQMNAGQSARNAGQSTKSILDKFQADIAILGSHSLLYNPIDKMMTKLETLNKRVLSYGKEITNFYGGEGNFQAIVNGIISGKISAVSEMDKITYAVKNGQLNAKTFNVLHEYYRNLNDLDSDSLFGTKQQKRLLLGLGMLYSENGNMDINKGRDEYLKMITAVKNGTMSVIDIFKELEKRLNKMKAGGTTKDLFNYMMASKFIFSETTSHQAFLNILNSKTMANQDVYLTDKYEGKRIKSLDQLSESEKTKYGKMLADGLIDITKEGIRLYKKGQTIEGADVLSYIEASAKDSAFFAKKTYESNLNLFKNKIETIKKDMETVKLNIGMYFIEPLSKAADVIKGFTSALKFLTNDSENFRALLGSLLSGFTTTAGVMALLLGGKALSFLTKKTTGLFATKSIDNPKYAQYLKAMDTLDKKYKVNRGFNDPNLAYKYMRDKQRISNLYAPTLRIEEINRSYKTMFGPIGLTFKQLNKEIPKSVTGFKKLSMQIGNFGRAIKKSGGLGGIVNRGYSNLLGSPAAMFGTMGAISLLTMGLGMMKKYNTFGLSDILGDEEEGRNNAFMASVYKGDLIKKMKSGGKATWDDLLPMLSNKDDFTKFKNLIDSTRKTGSELGSGTGANNRQANALLQVIVDQAAKHKHYSEGYYNDLYASETTLLLRQMDKFAAMIGNRNILYDKNVKGKDGKMIYGVSDAELLSMMERLNMNKNTINLLKADTSVFRQRASEILSKPEEYSKFIANSNSIDQKLKEMIASQKEPWTYNLYKWFESKGGKYLGAIAAGVGFGTLGLGAIFGAMGLGAVIGGLVALGTLFAAFLSKDNNKVLSALQIGGSILAGLTVGTATMNPILGVATTTAILGSVALDANMKKERELKFKQYLMKLLGYSDDQVLNSKKSVGDLRKELLEKRNIDVDIDSRYIYPVFKQGNQRGNVVFSEGRFIITDNNGKKISEVENMTPDQFQIVKSEYDAGKLKNIPYIIMPDGTARIRKGKDDFRGLYLKNLRYYYPDFKTITKDTNVGADSPETGFIDPYYSPDFSAIDLNTEEMVKQREAMEDLTAQLSKTEDLWYFDLNRGVYDERAYDPRSSSYGKKEEEKPIFNRTEQTSFDNLITELTTNIVDRKAIFELSDDVKKFFKIREVDVGVEKQFGMNYKLDKFQGVAR